MRNEIKLVKTYNVRNIEASEFLIVRDVEEDCVLIKQRHP